MSRGWDGPAALHAVHDNDATSVIAVSLIDHLRIRVEISMALCGEGSLDEVPA
jgi:hypothetical protein